MSGRPTKFELARIIAVDKATGLVSVARQCDEGSIWENIPLMTPMGNATSGAGFGYMPEVGATAHVMFPSDGSRPLVVGYSSPDTPGEGQTGGLPERDGGDLVLAAGEAGYIYLRKCGTLEIGAKGMSSLMFIPTKNILRAFFGNLEILSGLGSIAWTGDKDASGFRMAVATSSGGAEQVVIRAGHIDKGYHAAPDNVKGAADMNFELVVQKDGGATVAGIHVSSEGKTSFESVSDVGWSITGTFMVQVQGDITFRTMAALYTIAAGNEEHDVTGKFLLTAKQGLELKAGSSTVLNGGASTVSMQAGGTEMVRLTAGTVDLAGGAMPVALGPGTYGALVALAALLDPLTTPPGAATAALQPFLQTIKAQKVKAT